MTTPQRPPPTVIVHVRWTDASYERGECTTAELTPLVELESAGLLAAESEETISIALDRYDVDGVWRYIQHIPKVNVRSLRRIEVGGGGKRRRRKESPAGGG